MPSLFLISALVIASTVIFVSVLQNWRRGIVLIFVWLYLEDVIRRLTPDQPPEWKLVADVLVLLAYLSFLAGFVLRKHGSFWKPPFLGGLAVFLAAFAIAALNPLSPGIWATVIGVRTYLWYVPLVFLGYFMFDKVQSLESFCRFLVYTTIPLSVFGVLQYVMFDVDFPLIHPLAGAEGEVPYHPFEYIEGLGIPFITSVFGSPGRYARLSLLLFLLGMALWETQEHPWRNKVLLVAIVSAAVGVVISGSRTATYLLLLALGWYVLAGDKTIPGQFGVLMRRYKKCVLIGAFIIAGLWIATLAFPDLEFWIFGSTPEIYERLVVWAPNDIVNALEYAGPFGFGAGAFSQGVQYLSSGKEWLDVHRGLTARSVEGGEVWLMESGVAKLLYEFGLLGIGFYFFMVHVGLALKKQISSYAAPLERSIARATYVFLGVLLIWFSFVHHQVLGDTTTLVPLWFFIGVALRRRVEQRTWSLYDSSVRAK